MNPTTRWVVDLTAIGSLMAALDTLLSAAFPPEKRGPAIGIFSAITGLAVASGPLVGSVIEGGGRA